MMVVIFGWFRGSKFSQFLFNPSMYVLKYTESCILSLYVVVWQLLGKARTGSRYIHQTKIYSQSTKWFMKKYLFL